MTRPRPTRNRAAIDSDCLDNVLAGLIENVNLTATATESRIARIINRLLLSVRSGERRLDSWSLGGRPGATELSREANFDHSAHAN